MNNGFGEPSVVTAGEISRNFGQWQDRALSGPVIVTHHGRPRVVLVSADYYSSSKANVPRERDQPSFETSQAAILDHMAEAFMALDDQLRVTAVNHVFEALIGLSASQMVGRTWQDLFPPVTRAALAERLKRVLSSGEALDFEASGDGFSGRRYAVRAFPYPGGVAVLIQNRTAEHDMRSQLRQALALETALAAVSDLMVLRLNLRGLLAEVSDAFARLVGFSKEELLARRLSDLVDPSDRDALAAAVERVMQSGEPAQLSARLLVRDGGKLQARLGVAAVIDDLAPQGVAVAMRLDRQP